jgi:hypothetical protein
MPEVGILGPFAKPLPRLYNPYAAPAALNAVPAVPPKADVACFVVSYIDFLAASYPAYCAPAVIVLQGALSIVLFTVALNALFIIVFAEASNDDLTASLPAPAINDEYFNAPVNGCFNTVT